MLHPLLPYPRLHLRLAKHGLKFQLPRRPTSDGPGPGRHGLLPQTPSSSCAPSWDPRGKRCTATVTAQPVTSSWSTIRWRRRGVNLAFECWVGMGSDQSDTSTSRRQSRLDQNQNLVPKRSRMPPRHDDLLVVNVPSVRQPDCE